MQSQSTTTEIGGHSFVHSLNWMMLQTHSNYTNTYKHRDYNLIFPPAPREQWIPAKVSWCDSPTCLHRSPNEWQKWKTNPLGNLPEMVITARHGVYPVKHHDISRPFREISGDPFEACWQVMKPSDAQVCWDKFVVYIWRMEGYGGRVCLSVIDCDEINNQWWTHIYIYLIRTVTIRPSLPQGKQLLTGVGGPCNGSSESPGQSWGQLWLQTPEGHLGQHCNILQPIHNVFFLRQSNRSIMEYVMWLSLIDIHCDIWFEFDQHLRCFNLLVLLPHETCRTLALIFKSNVPRVAMSHLVRAGWWGWLMGRARRA